MVVSSSPPVSEDDLRQYLASTTISLVQEFIKDVIEKMPDDTVQFMLDFAKRKMLERDPTTSKEDASNEDGDNDDDSVHTSSSSEDTESLLLGSTRPSSPRRINELPSSMLCTQCSKLEDVAHVLKIQFLSVSYEMFRLSQVPPWEAAEEIQKARKKTIAHCKAVCTALENASLDDNKMRSGLDNMVCKTRGGADDSSSSSFQSDDSEIGSLPDVFEKFPVKWRAGARESVCAESQSVIEQHELPKYHKTTEELSRIRSCIEKCFIWACISKEENDIKTLMETMKPVHITSGLVLMRQGDTGDGMYFVDNGTMSVDREAKDGRKHLRDVGPGEVVGELAVLYRTNRSSTVTATSDCLLWFLDRHSFNALVRGSAKAKRDRFDQFLKSVPILKSMGLYSRGRLADVLDEQVFQPNDVIIREGDTTVDNCYIVYDGIATATRESEPQVRRYERGDMFGECGILYDTCRLATVTAETQTKVVTIERKAFKRVFIDIHNELMAQALSKYPRPPLLA